MKKIASVCLAVLLGIGMLTASGCTSKKYPTDRKLKVACVGDSITAGGYWKNNLHETLSADNYEVEGFGKSGATALLNGIDYIDDWTNGPKAFIDQFAYTESMAYGADIVVIMLGTNDSKEVNWPEHKDEFVDDYIHLITSYQNSETAPTVFIALPPTVYSVGKFQGISNDVIEQEIIPKIQEVAKATNVTIIDTHTPTQNNEELVSDGVHPSTEGKQVLCETIAAAIIADTDRE